MEIKEIKPIITELKAVLTEMNMKISDDMLWDTAVRVYNSRIIQNSKEEKAKEPASDAQKNFIDNLKNQGKIKVEISTDLTKAEASALINKAVGK